MVPISTIYSLLEHQATGSPDSVAIMGLNTRPLTYKQLFAQVTKVSKNLFSLGIRRGDRVAIVLPTGPDLAAAFLSVACAAVAAPLNPAYVAAEFEFYLADLGASALIVEKGTGSPAIEVARKLCIRVLEIIPSTEVFGPFEFVEAPPSTTPPSAPPLPEDEALVLHTSGTTARPKIVPLTHENLCASAKQIGQSLQLTPADGCLNIMPLFHVHGLMAAVLASVMSGASVLATPGLDAPRFLDWIAKFQPTWFTAVPSMLHSIALQIERRPTPLHLHRLRFIRSCSSALSPTLMSSLERSFGVPVIEAYGMTEASHQITCNPLPPAVHKPGSVGLPAGVAVAIMDPHGSQLLPPNHPGEIVLRGESVMRGYANLAPGEGFSQGWFRTGDLGRIDSEGYVFIEGRIKEIINRGGEKIAPREVEEVLLDHPAVKQAVVFAVPDEVLGQEIGAALVLRDSSAGERDLRQFAAARLSHFKVPSHIVFLDELPLGPTGKLQRIGLAEKLGLKGRLTPTAVSAKEDESPKTREQEILAKIWCEVLNVSAVGIHQKFLELGGDSLSAARAVARISQRFEAEIDLIEFLDAPTVADQALFIAQKSIAHDQATLL